MPVERFDAHPAHQGGHVFAAHDHAPEAKQVSEHPAPGEGVFQVQLIKLPHHGQGGRQDGLGGVVHRRPGERQELALPGDG